jgi:hypothetical protein
MAEFLRPRKVRAGQKLIVVSRVLKQPDCAHLRSRLSHPGRALRCAVKTGVRRRLSERVDSRPLKARGWQPAAPRKVRAPHRAPASPNSGRKVRAHRKGQDNPPDA